MVHLVLSGLLGLLALALLDQLVLVARVDLAAQVVPQVLPILGKEHGQLPQLILSMTVLRMTAVVMCAYLPIHLETQTMSQEQVLLGRHIGTC